MRFVLVVGCCASAALSAQTSPPSTPAPRVILSRSEEIRLAVSGAPPAVTKDARVYVLKNGRYVVAQPGKTGVACQISRSQALSLEPECGDEEADKTVLAIERFRVEQRLAGRPNADIVRAVADSIAAGRFRLPRRPAMVYMMSSAQILYSDNGSFVGRWLPHLMLYIPFLRESDIGVSVGSMDVKGPMVDKPGTALSNITVVMRNFVDPAPVP